MTSGLDLVIRAAARGVLNEGHGKLARPPGRLYRLPNTVSPRRHIRGCGSANFKSDCALLR